MLTKIEIVSEVVKSVVIVVVIFLLAPGWCLVGSVL